MSECLLIDICDIEAVCRGIVIAYELHWYIEYQP